jgi:hypothetical protein
MNNCWWHLGIATRCLGSLHVSISPILGLKRPQRTFHWPQLGSIVLARLDGMHHRAVFNSRIAGLQSLEEARTPLGLNHFEDDHWHYERRQDLSISITSSTRPNQHVLEPQTIQGRGRPRRNEASTRRDPSAFERPVPPNFQALQVKHAFRPIGFVSPFK